MGDCDSDVARWLQDRRIRKIFKDIPDSVLRDHLKEFGAWDEAELQDRSANSARLLFVAAGQCQDNEETWYYC
jgi:hypothetical protein